MSRLDRPLGDLIAQLDRVGFDVGTHRVSVWSALLVVVVLVTVVVVARLGTLAARRALGRIHRLDPTQRLLGEKLVSIAIWAAAILVGIDLLGIDLTALAVFSGAAGLAIGFGLQKTVGNLIAGIILLMDRSIKPGDIVVVGDGSSMGGSALPGGVPNVGRVAKIGVRAVNVITRDGEKHLIPNELLMTQAVENWSYASPEVRVRMRVPVAYDCDLRLAQRLMVETAKENPRILNEPEPVVWITAFGERAVEHELRYWISDPEAGLGNIQGEVFLGIWDRFKEAGIRIPYPRQDIRMVGAPDDNPAPTEAG